VTLIKLQMLYSVDRNKNINMKAAKVRFWQVVVSAYFHVASNILTHTLKYGQ